MAGQGGFPGWRVFEVKVQWKTLWLMLLLFCLAGQAYAAVGVATQVNGGVTLTRDYKMFALEEGVEINAHDVIRTGSGGGAQLDMNDGSSLSIGANSTMNLSNYTLREDKSVVSAMVEMVSGWMRFAVAKLKSRDSSYRFKTPTAVLGVRGTEGILHVEGEKSMLTSSLWLKSGVVDIARGLRKGRLYGTRLTLKKGQFASRKVGRVLRMRLKPPAVFMKRLPQHMKLKLKRRVLKLKRRGIKPRLIRKLRPKGTLLRKGLSDTRLKPGIGFEHKNVLKGKMLRRGGFAPRGTLLPAENPKFGKGRLPQRKGLPGMKSRTGGFVPGKSGKRPPGVRIPAKPSMPRGAFRTGQRRNKQLLRMGRTPVARPALGVAGSVLRPQHGKNPPALLREHQSQFRSRQKDDQNMRKRTAIPTSRMQRNVAPSPVVPFKGMNLMKR